MPQIIPDALEVEVLTEKLTPALTLRLFANNVTPVGTTTVAAFSEVTGGGYASKPLTFGNWGFVSGDPSIASYNASQSWVFTGPTGGPATIFGYYVTRNSDGMLMWSQRFDASVVPFVPVAGSEVRVLPRLSAQSLN